MNKITFMETLKQGLKKHNIKDIDEIMDDYEVYFINQEKQGRSEEEATLRLGDLKSIIGDYVESPKGNRRQWFDLVTIGFIAIPMLILLYGVLATFIGGSIASWAISIYYLFQVNSFSFMPDIPFGVHFLYIVTMLTWSVFFFCLSVRFAATLKSMTMQYLVKQSIRIGDYQIKDIYVKLFKYSLLIGTLLLVLTYAVSALVAKDFQYWHVWGWFN